MSHDLYHRAILDAAAAAVGAGSLPSPHGRASVDNPLCGDRVDVEVCLSGARVSALAHRVRGCVLCEAAASLIGECALGATAPEVAEVSSKVNAMLEGAGAEFEPPWESLRMFSPARDFRSRHECVTLAFEALAAALADAEGRRESGSGAQPPLLAERLPRPPTAKR